MAMNAIALKPEDRDNVEALLATGQAAMRKRITLLMQQYPVLKDLEQALPELMETVKLLIVQSYLKGQSVTLTKQAVRIEKLAKANDDITSRLRESNHEK